MKAKNNVLSPVFVSSAMEFCLIYGSVSKVESGIIVNLERFSNVIKMI